jgi:hypothetical protein
MKTAYYEIKLSLRGLSAKSTAILDRAIVYADRISITDIKTGRDETPDIPEVDTYVLAARQTWGENTIIFNYLYSRTGHWLTYVYHWKNRGHVRADGPNGYRRDLVSTNNQDPLQAKVESYIDEMRLTPPIPTPGPHCESMFGEPCQFLGAGCPLEPDPRESFNAPMSTGEQELIAANIMRLPEEKRPGAAFMLLRDGFPVEQLPPNVISYAYQGVMQLRQGASNVAERIRSWCYPDRSFSVGKADYGMRAKRITDVEQALKLLAANDVSIEDLAKILSTSASGLKKLSKRKYGSLGADIAEACVYYADGKDFGKL